MSIITDHDQIKAILEKSQHVAVLGAHPQTARPAHFVPQYLHEQGYTIYPVNGAKVGQTLWGKGVVATLAELEAAIDIVDVFRRPDLLHTHLDDILAMKPLPKVVWLQKGIRNDEFAEKLSAEGIDVVQDHCTLADHKAMGLSPKA